MTFRGANAPGQEAFPNHAQPLALNQGLNHQQHQQLQQHQQAQFMSPGGHHPSLSSSSSPYANNAPPQLQQQQQQHQPQFYPMQGAQQQQQQSQYYQPQQQQQPQYGRGGMLVGGGTGGMAYQGYDGYGAHQQQQQQQQQHHMQPAAAQYVPPANVWPQQNQLQHQHQHQQHHQMLMSSQYGQQPMHHMQQRPIVSPQQHHQQFQLPSPQPRPMPSPQQRQQQLQQQQLQVQQQQQQQQLQQQRQQFEAQQRQFQISSPQQRKSSITSTNHRASQPSPQLPQSPLHSQPQALPQHQQRQQQYQQQQQQQQHQQHLLTPSPKQRQPSLPRVPQQRTPSISQAHLPQDLSQHEQPRHAQTQHYLPQQQQQQFHQQFHQPAEQPVEPVNPLSFEQKIEIAQPTPPVHQIQNQQPSLPSLQEPKFEQQSTISPQQLYQPAEQQMHFVNLQDIQNIPPPRPIKIEQPQMPQPISDPIMASPVQESITVKRSPKPDVASLNRNTQQQQQQQNMGPPRVKVSPRSSVSSSPALTARSPSISKKSPALPHKPRPVDTIPLMAAISEECFEKARSAVHDVAMSLHPARVDEYQRLITTGLECLEAAIASGRLAPRQEAKMRIRYAAIVLEETENLMEAETALTKGITLCDKHRLFDLKYCMQYIMLKVLFERNRKAALNAAERHIDDCKTYKHINWLYAFRLLKAKFYIECGQATDAGALENIRALRTVASSRGDNALSVFTSLLEGLALLKTAKDGRIERVQACIAEAAKHQFDPSVKILQLDVLMLLLDLASSVNYLAPEYTWPKLKRLQTRLDECREWGNCKADFLLPIQRQSSTTKNISKDTAAIVRPGEPDEQSDYLVVSFMTKMELTSIVFMLSGISTLHRPNVKNPHSENRKSAELWREGLGLLENWDNSTRGIPYGASISLKEAIRQREWRFEAQAYLDALLGLYAASRCQWDTVAQFMRKLECSIALKTQPLLRSFAIYLSGVYHQGTGDIAVAHNIFRDKCFDISQDATGVKAAQHDLALLANLNRLWIMQHPSQRDERETRELIEQLQSLCESHPSEDLRAVWHNVMAAIVTDPPQMLNQQRQHLHRALSGNKGSQNIMGAAITLSIMRNRLFDHVVGEQALKSALAASKQAHRSGNVLMKSVADGMLAQSHDVQGQRDEAQLVLKRATQEAVDAFARS